MALPSGWHGIMRGCRVCPEESGRKLARKKGSSGC